METEHTSQQRRTEKAPVSDPRVNADTVALYVLELCSLPAAVPLSAHPLPLVPFSTDRPPDKRGAYH